METAVSAPEPVNAAGGGRSNGVRPSLSSDFLHLLLVLSAGVGTPRDFMAPARATNGAASGGTLNRDLGPTSFSARTVHHVPGCCRAERALEIAGLLLRLVWAAASASLLFSSLDRRNVSRRQQACLGFRA